MSLMTNFFNASTAAWSAFRRTFGDPSQTFSTGFEYTPNTGIGSGFNATNMPDFGLLWALYNGSRFDKGMASWSAYKSRYGLYRDMRDVYNPTHRLVEFYAESIYPGVLSEDGNDLPDGTSLAIPFAEDIKPELKDAIAQFWQWTNFQAQKSIIPRYGAALGSVLVEIDDDYLAGKVTAKIWWPGFVDGLQLDNSGNVKSYALQYKIKDDTTMATVVYRKEVDIFSIREYRDRQLIKEIDNPYGFAPAVWYKHSDTGAVYGAPAIDGSIAKIDELNSLASHAHDQVHKVIGAPLIAWTKSFIEPLFSQSKRPPGENEFAPTPTSGGENENILLLKGAEGGRVDSLAGNLNLADTITYMKELISELESDHPELAYNREMRAMSTLTGPAASRVMSDVLGKLGERAAAYDQATLKLFQMAVAIAGFRLNGGFWNQDENGFSQTISPQQEKFRPYNLDSYRMGQIDLAILPRQLIRPTNQEKAAEKLALWQGVQAAVTAGAPLEFVLKDAGFSEEELKELATLIQQKQVQEQAQLKMQQSHQLEVAKVQGQSSQQQQGQSDNGQQQGQPASKQLASGKVQ
jgi:RNAse (barnase) inhibitor barstar